MSIIKYTVVLFYCDRSSASADYCNRVTTCLENLENLEIQVI